MLVCPPAAGYPLRCSSRVFAACKPWAIGPQAAMRRTPTCPRCSTIIMEFPPFWPVPRRPNWRRGAAYVLPGQATRSALDHAATDRGIDAVLSGLVERRARHGDSSGITTWTMHRGPLWRPVPPRRDRRGRPGSGGAQRRHGPPWSTMSRRFTRGRDRSPLSLAVRTMHDARHGTGTAEGQNMSTSMTALETIPLPLKISASVHDAGAAPGDLCALCGRGQFHLRPRAGERCGRGSPATGSPGVLRGRGGASAERGGGRGAGHGGPIARF